MANASASLPELETKLATDANTVLDGVLDLNVSMATLAGKWDVLMKLRSRLLMMHGVAADQAKYPSNASTKSPAAASFPPAMMLAWQAAMMGGGKEDDFKSQLQTEVSKRAKRTLTKGELVYTVTPDETGKLYTATVHGATDGLLQQPYESAAPVSGKRAAEHAAAKAALEAEFWPAWGGKGGKGGKGGNGGMGGMGALASMKALGAPSEPPGSDAKSRMNKAAQLLLGRLLNKGEVAYVTSPVEGQGSVCTVSIPAHDPSASWTGAPAGTTKQAEINAAEAALAALADTLTAIEGEKKEKRKAQDQEKLERKKAKLEAGGAFVS